MCIGTIELYSAICFSSEDSASDAGVVVDQKDNSQVWGDENVCTSLGRHKLLMQQKYNKYSLWLDMHIYMPVKMARTSDVFWKMERACKFHSYIT